MYGSWAYLFCKEPQLSWKLAVWACSLLQWCRGCTNTASSLPCYRHRGAHCQHTCRHPAAQLVQHGHTLRCWCAAFLAQLTLTFTLCVLVDERVCLVPFRDGPTAEREGNAVLARQWLLLWCARTAVCLLFPLFSAPCLCFQSLHNSLTDPLHKTAMYGAGH